MSILDSIILIVLVLGLWQGYRNGLMRSLVGLFGWLIALVFATYFAKFATLLFIGFTDSPVLAGVMAFLAVALLVIVLLQLVLWLMQQTLKGLKLGILDKLAGAIFASAKNLLVILLILSVVAPFIKTRPIWQQSQIAQALLPFAPFATKLSKRIATDISDNTRTGMQKLDKVSQQLDNSQH